jgi:hypothetical protein
MATLRLGRLYAVGSFTLRRVSIKLRVKVLLTMDPPCLHLNSYLRGVPMDQALMLRIRERAYHIWTATGADADQNWLRAETEMLNNSVAQPSVAQPQQKNRPGAFRRKAKKTASTGQAAAL